MRQMCYNDNDNYFYCPLITTNVSKPPQQKIPCIFQFPHYLWNDPYNNWKVVPRISILFTTCVQNGPNVCPRVPHKNNKLEDRGKTSQLKFAIFKLAFWAWFIWPTYNDLTRSSFFSLGMLPKDPHTQKKFSSYCAGNTEKLSTQFHPRSRTVHGRSIVVWLKFNRLPIPISPTKGTWPCICV